MYLKWVSISDELNLNAEINTTALNKTVLSVLGDYLGMNLEQQKHDEIPSNPSPF